MDRREGPDERRGLFLLVGAAFRRATITKRRAPWPERSMKLLISAHCLLAASGVFGVAPKTKPQQADTFRPAPPVKSACWVPY